MADLEIKGAKDKTDKESRFNDQVGQTAKVERDSTESELAHRANLALRGIGEDLNPLAKQGLQYKGSAAFHVYQSEILGQIFFVTQTDTLQDVPEITSSKAIENFVGDLMESYGRKRQRRRSGF